MKNETFREIGYWGSFGAAILSIVNVIICLVKSIKEYKAGEYRDFVDIISKVPEYSYASMLFKITVGILLFSFVMMFISYMINASGTLKVFMIIMKALQLGCIGFAVLNVISVRSISVAKIPMIILGVAEVVIFILYLIDSDHRKSIIRMAVFSIQVLGAGFIFMLMSILLILAVCISICSVVDAVLRASEPRFALYDTTGKFVGWIARS